MSPKTDAYKTQILENKCLKRTKKTRFLIFFSFNSTKNADENEKIHQIQSKIAI